jgi:serine/threonine-protein kinase HipA
MVSARTMLRLGEMGIGASYSDLADLGRQRFDEPQATLRELFARITFNVLVGNTDDHARNHAAFWDGSQLTLTPAYDIAPQIRTGERAAQAMAVGADGFRDAQLAGCVARSRHYHLSEREARSIIDHQIDVIRAEYDSTCDEARMVAEERASYWGRQFLNAYALRDY